jgi:hypothetical protein
MSTTSRDRALVFNKVRSNWRRKAPKAKAASKANGSSPPSPPLSMSIRREIEVLKVSKSVSQNYISVVSICSAVQFARTEVDDSIM